MEKEYEVLSHIQEEEYTSQRKIAERTGLSVGSVNILLKRMIKKGLVKIERLNARSLRYILTPRGFAIKVKHTRDFIKNSYRYIFKVSNTMKGLAKDIENDGKKKMCLYGPRDEVYQILKMALEEEDMPYTFLERGLEVSEKEGFIFVVWDLHDEKEFEDCEFINIMRLI